MRIALILVLALLSLKPALASADAETNAARSLPVVRVSLGRGQPGIQHVSGKLVWQRFADLKLGQRLDFWGMSQQGDFTLRVLTPDGKFWFDADPASDPTAPKGSRVRGFAIEADIAGRHIIQFLVDANRRVTVQSHGYLGKVKPVTMPGTWSLDYESMAFAKINRSGSDMARLSAVAERLRRTVQYELTLRAHGAWTSTMSFGRSPSISAGTWSMTGNTLHQKFLTRNGKALRILLQVTQDVTLEDRKLVWTAGGEKFILHKVR